MVDVPRGLLFPDRRQSRVWIWGRGNYSQDVIYERIKKTPFLKRKKILILLTMRNKMRRERACMRRYWDIIISIINWLAVFVYFVEVHVQKAFFFWFWNIIFV